MKGLKSRCFFTFVLLCCFKERSLDIASCSAYTYPTTIWTVVCRIVEFRSLYALIVDPVIKIPVTWPHGTYGLYHPKSGCPKAAFTWEEGWNRQDAEDHDNVDSWSPTIHLDGIYFCFS